MVPGVGLGDSQDLSAQCLNNEYQDDFAAGILVTLATVILFTSVLVDLSCWFPVSILIE